jgi:arginine deiminase
LTTYYDAEYLSRSIDGKWIDMNLFDISPNLVVVDQDQTVLNELMKKQGLDFMRLKLRHSKMMDGGYHCITLDIRRTGTLQ